MADRVSARRQLVNSFFLTLTISLTALVGYARLGSNELDNLESLALMAFAGAVVSVLWLLMIKGAGRRRFTRIEAGVPCLFLAVHGFVLLVSMMSIVTQHLR